MKRFRRVAFSSIGSLRTFGVILFLITLIVIVNWLAIEAIAQPADTIYNELVKLTFLEDEISFYLLEMDINADYYDFSGGDDHYRSEYHTYDALIKETLVNISPEANSFLEADEAYYNQLVLAIEAHNQTFDNLQHAVSSGDLNQISATQTDLNNETNLAQKIITDWTYQIEARRITAWENTDKVIKIAILVSILGLVFLPFLAFWAFSLISDITRPILILSDTLTSIQGGRLQSERIAEVSERKDNLGQFARDIELMYAEAIRRQQALKNELDTLNQQLKEARRRKRS